MLKLSSAAILLVCVLFCCVGLFLQQAQSATYKTKTPVASSRQLSPVVTSIKQFDAEFGRFLKDWSVPGAALAVVKKGKVVYAKGYGWADVDAKIPVSADSLFRIASISKSVTAVACLKLVEMKKLNLDEKAFAILDDYNPCCGKEPADPRVLDITVRDLLQCTAGWSSKHGGDPMFVPHLEAAAKACGVGNPPDTKAIIRYWLDRKLTFAPGTSWGYNNIGYAVLGEIIARRAGKSFEEFVREDVLAPAGIFRICVGRTMEKFPDEVIYYPFPGQPTVPSIFPHVKEQVHYQYGGDFDVQTIAAPAGMIASPLELVKFAAAISGETGNRILEAESVKLMLSKPKCPYWTGKKGYFALGWEVYAATENSGMTYSRVGTIPGAMAFLVHRYDGTCWAVCFNSRPLEQDRFMEQAKKLIWSAVNNNKSW